MEDSSENASDSSEGPSDDELGSPTVATERKLVPSRTIHVRNLGFDIGSSALETAFSRFGAVSGVRIITRPRGREVISVGYGFVEFRTQESCTAALSFPGKIVVNGRTIGVGPCIPDGKRDTAFLAGIPKGTTQEEVKAAFAAYHPTTVRIVHENDDDIQTRGFAFVTFATEDDRTKAVEEHKGGISLHGGISHVRFARPRGISIGQASRRSIEGRSRGFH
jgi:RNA recognition motif-containing protein